MLTYRELGRICCSLGIGEAIIWSERARNATPAHLQFRTFLLDVADIKKQVQFWQDQGRLDKRIVADDLLDVSFIGEETIAPQSWRR